MIDHPLEQRARLTVAIDQALALADAANEALVGCHLSAAREALSGGGGPWTAAEIEAAIALADGTYQHRQRPD